MNKFQKIELTLILFILMLNLIFFVFLKDQGIISGFFLSEPNDSRLKTPFDFISEDDIHIYDDKIVIEIENYTLSRYDSSGSMIPILGEGVTGIGIKPKSEKDLHVGDIISFKQEDILIVHRIIEKGVDKNGCFFITKGDNNFLIDKKVRFSEIDSVLVALIY